MMTLRCFLLILPAVLVACSPGVTRDEVMATARAYKEMAWMPEERHIHHGKDFDGQWVHTPDASLEKHTGDPKGWWKPGVEAVGMPYMWGGFDTPESFRKKLRRGAFAGDIATDDKKRLLEAGVSRHAAGIDCSGFVSRCWNLPRHHSTRRLHLVSHQLDSWDELRRGDILLASGHVVIFAGWTEPGRVLLMYEAGPYPVWRVNASRIRKETLLALDYTPWRYNHIRD